MEFILLVSHHPQPTVSRRLEAETRRIRISEEEEIHCVMNTLPLPEHIPRGVAEVVVVDRKVERSVVEEYRATAVANLPQVLVGFGPCAVVPFVPLVLRMTPRQIARFHTRNPDCQSNRLRRMYQRVSIDSLCFEI